MSVPVYRHVTGSDNQIYVTSVYRHTVCKTTNGPQARSHSRFL